MPLLSRHLDMNIRLLPALPSPSSWLSVEHRLWTKCAAMIFITVQDEIQLCRNIYGQFPGSTFPIAAAAELSQPLELDNLRLHRKNKTQKPCDQQEAGHISHTKEPGTNKGVAAPDCGGVPLTWLYATPPPAAAILPTSDPPSVRNKRLITLVIIRSHKL